MEIMSMEEVKRRAERRTHWFDRDTIKFFKSRPAETAYTVREPDGTVYAYFTSSEKGPDNVRRYSVNVLPMVPDKQWWQMKRVGEFQQHSTRSSAHKAMNDALARHELTQDKGHIQ